MIENLRNDFTVRIEHIPGNLELLLDTKLKARSDQKPQAILLKYDSGAIVSDKIQALVDIVNRCIT